MGYDFNADEIFQIAERIEINGAKFYREMSENISDPTVRQTLLDLADMEDAHRDLFASMRIDLAEGEGGSTVFDPEGEAALYLRALADLRVFDEKAGEAFALSDGLSENDKIIKIFWAALGREKESIVFYLGMKDLVPEKLGKSRIEGIIREEMKHLRFLSNKLSLLKK